MPTNVTFGQIRATLKTAGESFSIDPAKLDTDVVPLHKLGGRVDNLVKAADAPKLNLAEIMTVPTGNPLLIARRQELNLTKAPLTAIRRLPQFTLPETPAPTPPPTGSGGSAHAVAVDWRHRGWPWLCTVQDQIGENCWAMAAWSSCSRLSVRMRRPR